MKRGNFRATRFRLTSQSFLNETQFHCRSVCCISDVVHVHWKWIIKKFTITNNSFCEQLYKLNMNRVFLTESQRFYTIEGSQIGTVQAVVYITTVHNSLPSSSIVFTSRGWSHCVRSVLWLQEKHFPLTFGIQLCIYTGSRLQRVRLQRAPGYNELISLHQNNWLQCLKDSVIMSTLL